MLQSIHDKAKGWVAYLIIFLISIPFALFGINSYLGGGSDKIVAKVNGEEIKSSVIDNELLQLKQQFAQLSAMDDNALKQIALDRVVSRTLLEQEIKKQGYRGSTNEVLKEISQIELFQRDGKFDATLYKQVLAANRRNEAIFEQSIRSEIAQRQFQNLVSMTALIPKSEAEQYQVLKTQKRNIEVFTIKTADYKEQIQVSDAEIKDYYEKNKSRFMTAEQVKLAYIELKLSDFAKSINPSDEELKSYYEANKDRYVISEKRYASHIVIEIPSEDKAAEAKQKADKLFAEIESGTRSFEEVAKAESADTVSKDNGGDLGIITASDWDKSFNDTVFSLKEGEVSEPVKTPAGYEIIKLTKLEPAVQKSFEEAKADVDNDYRNEQATEMFQNKDDELPTLAYENENDLAPVADALHVERQVSDWISRNQGSGIGALPQVREMAFSDEVKLTGKNSEKIDIEDGHSLVIRVIEQKPAEQKPLADVKEEIVAALKDQAVRKKVMKLGESLLAKLKTTQNWSALTDLSLGDESKVEKTGNITRKSRNANKQVIATAFAMNKPATGKIEYSNVIMPNGDYTVIALKAVQAGEAKLDNNALSTYEQYIASREQVALLQALREEAEVEIYPENL